MAGNDVYWAYGYNPAGQIAGIGRENDAYAWTGHFGVDRAYAANGLNQYQASVSELGSAAYGYDANGNLTSDGSRTYVYDIENRLVSATPLPGVAGSPAALVYDPLGRLFQVSTPVVGVTRFLYDGDALVVEYNGGNLMARRHLHWPGADVPMMTWEGDGFDPNHLHADERGSIITVDNAAGLPTINRYDEYGIPGAGNVGRFQYTGQAWLAELGMYYYKARIYSPTLGRFMQTDPVEYQDRFNLYAYVGNDPINSVDFDGERTTFIGGFNDENSTIVRSYAQAYQRSHPSEVVNYFPYYQWRLAAAAISARLRDGERNVVIGHSWGGANAIAASTLGRRRIDLLVTIDPIGAPPLVPLGSSLKPGNVSRWLNVSANPSDPNLSDFVAFVGGGSTPLIGADESYAVDANHEDFSSMMGRSPAENRVNSTRAGSWSIDGSRITGSRGCGSRLRETGC